MTGGAFVPASVHDAEEFELGDVHHDEEGSPADTSSPRTHAVQWVGRAAVKGPKWARMPLLTGGMLGIQVRILLGELVSSVSHEHS